MHSDVIIRKCKRSDWKGIMDVCYLTGYMGEDAQGHFGDKFLFGLLFSIYYPWFEWWNCFVAVHNNKVIGYILGSLDSNIQHKMFIAKIGPLILARLALVSWWRYPNTLKILVHLIKQFPQALNNNAISDSDINLSYPAHLHIDILAPYQHQGIGSKLISLYENHVKSHNVPGIHLDTSNKNFKAIPFYFKHGYKIIRKLNSSLWPDSPNTIQLTFAKKLK